MKLATFQSYIVKNPPPGFGGRYFIFVTLTTSCGITGTGEIYAASFAPEIITAMASDIFQRYLEGQNPFQIEKFCRRAHGSGFSHRPDPSLQGVVSGLEIACWDIIGKAADRPVYDLLGGQVHDSLRTYTYLYPQADQDAGQFYSDPSANAETAISYVEQGFTAVKFDPAGKYTVFDGRMPDSPALDRSAAFCAAIRDAVGDKADLLFGTHGQFTAAGAIRLAERLAPMTRCGSRNQHRPTCQKKWPRSPPVARYPLPLANGFAPNMNLPGYCAVAQRPYYNRIWAGLGYFGSQENSRHCRDLLCADRTASLLRASGGGRQYSTGHRDPKFLNP